MPKKPPNSKSVKAIVHAEDKRRNISPAEYQAALKAAAPGLFRQTERGCACEFNLSKKLAYHGTGF